MNRSRLVFLVVVGAALALALAGVLRDQFNQSSSSEGTPGADSGANSGPIILRVAVSPLASDWIESAVQSYNGERKQVNRRVVEIRVETQDSLPLWTAPGKWTAINHPTIWIPEMTAAIEYAHDTGLRYSVTHPSLGSTVMVWGLPQDRMTVLENQYDTLNWRGVQEASVASAWETLGGPAEWRFFKPAFAQPDRYTSGMAALLVAAAEFHGQPVLDATMLSDPEFAAWLKPVVASVPNFASLGAYPAVAIATQGVSVADVALLPESEWLVNYRGLTAKVGALAFVYPAYQVGFDFPFAIWDGPETSAAEREAAQDFLRFLLSDDQQRSAAGFGLRGANGIPASTSLFDQARSAGIVVDKPGGEIIQLPARSALTSFALRDWASF
jgi:hypothetical protein